jgi:hypothetical protein
MSTRPQLSLCFPEIDASSASDQALADVSAFFSKFPVTYEVLVAGKRAANQSAVTISSSRAKNLESLFRSAQGEFIFAMGLDLSIPLSECFKILQELISDPELGAVFGDRTQKKKKLENTEYRTTLPRIENFFSGILHEKTKWPFKDPFCPVFALRKSALDQIAPEIKSSGWHWTPEVQSWDY